MADDDQPHQPDRQRADLVGRAIGAVLVGGASRRMGSDKALLDVGGSPLGRRAVDALRGAGLTEVVLIGGDETHVGPLGGTAVADLWPGDGPVGGLLTALHQAFLAGRTAVVCLACDLPAVTPRAVEQLLDHAATNAATSAPPARPTVVTIDGRRAYPNGWWPVAVLPRLEERFVDGAVSFAELLDGIEVDEADGGDSFTDADEPGDLSQFL